MTDIESIFLQAWSDPAHTRIELPPLEVNRAIDSRDWLHINEHVSGEVLWENEVLKARDPTTYIPCVVRTGQILDRQSPPGASETFMRVSQQRQWLSPDVFDTIIERTCLNHRDRRATFMGIRESRRPMAH